MINRFCLFLGLILIFGLGISSYLAIRVYHESDLFWCFSSACFEYAYHKFSTPIGVFRSTGIFVAYVAALGGSLIGVSTYMLSVSKSNNDRHQDNLKDFRLQVRDILSRFNAIKEPEFIE